MKPHGSLPRSHPSLIPTSIQEDPVHSLTPYFMTHFNIILPSTSNKKYMLMCIVECKRRAAGSSRGTGFSSRPRGRQCQRSYHTDSQFQPNAALHPTLTNINILGYTFQLKLVAIIKEILKNMHEYRGKGVTVMVPLEKIPSSQPFHIMCILI